MLTNQLLTAIADLFVTPTVEKRVARKIKENEHALFDARRDAEDKREALERTNLQIDQMERRIEALKRERYTKK